MSLASATKEDVIGRGDLCAINAFECDLLGGFNVGLSIKPCLGLYIHVLIVIDKAYTVGLGLFTVRGRIADFIVTQLCILGGPPQFVVLPKSLSLLQMSVYTSPGKYCW